jgi:hypothetical protein
MIRSVGLYNQPMLRRLLACLLLVSLPVPLAAQKRAKAHYMKKDPQTVLAEAAPKNYVPAEKPCDNYGWAAAVEMVLKAKQVVLPQRDWVMKAYGGYKCISPLSAAAYTELLRYVRGDYALTPERRVRIEAEFMPGAPTQADPVIAGLREGETLMLVWKGKPYVWYGVVYDEYIHLAGNRMFEMTELKLLDPLAKTEKERLVSFVKGKDDANGIDGVMRVTVTAR